MTARRLDFVVGGAQKSGTTTLEAVLREHPAIQMAHLKETHVFDDESRDWSDPQGLDLESFFPEWDGRLRGEATPVTLYWRPAVRRLRDHNPDVKMLLLLRDPVVRAYANWCKEYAAGLEDLPFAEAIGRGRDRVAAQAEIEGLHRVFSYVERGFYGQQLDYLFRYLPSSNVHCEVFEEFVADPGPSLTRIADFLGVAPFAPDIALPHLHPREAIAYPSPLLDEDVRRLCATYREDVRATQELLGRRLPWLAAT